MAITDFSFKRFAQQPFYRQVNSQLVHLAGIQPGQHVVDLACGTGTVTQLILEKLRGAKDSLVIALDYSAEALQQAKAELGKVKSEMVKLMQGRAEQLSQIVKERVDAVFFCNAIHLIQEKSQLVAEVYHTLRCGGVFAFNTAFFQGAQLPETEQFYRRWMSAAIRLLKRQHNLLPQREKKVEARRQLTPEQYVELLQRQGFTLKEQQICPIAVPLDGWLGISQYEDFINGVLPGVPKEVGSLALQQGASQVFKDLKLQSVPRNWLQVVAVRL